MDAELHGIKFSVQTSEEKRQACDDFSIGPLIFALREDLSRFTERLSSSVSIIISNERKKVVIHADRSSFPRESANRR